MFFCKQWLSLENLAKVVYKWYSQEGGEGVPMSEVDTQHAPARLAIHLGGELAVLWSVDCPCIPGITI